MQIILQLQIWEHTKKKSDKNILIRNFYSKKISKLFIILLHKDKTFGSDEYFI